MKNFHFFIFFFKIVSLSCDMTWSVFYLVLHVSNKISQCILWDLSFCKNVLMRYFSNLFHLENTSQSLFLKSYWIKRRKCLYQRTIFQFSWPSEGCNFWTRCQTKHLRLQICPPWSVDKCRYPQNCHTISLEQYFYKTEPKSPGWCWF